MTRPIDEAIARFLATATDALQGDIGRSGIVEDLTLDDVGPVVVLIAKLRVGNGTTEARGAGENLVTAYADLRLQAAERLLVSAFTDLVNA